MTGLVELNLNSNQISDIGPLVDNAGIDDGDEVNIIENAFECDQEDLDDIDELESRGVNVQHDCY